MVKNEPLDDEECRIVKSEPLHDEKFSIVKNAPPDAEKGEIIKQELKTTVHRVLPRPLKSAMKKSAMTNYSAGLTSNYSAGLTSNYSAGLTSNYSAGLTSTRTYVERTHQAVRNHQPVTDDDVEVKRESRLARIPDFNVRGRRGGNALHIAAQEGREDLVAALIADGADVLAKTAKGYQAIHLACWFGHTDLVELLVKKGADLYAMSPRGDPLTIAFKRNHRGIISVFRSEAIEVQECHRLPALKYGLRMYKTRGGKLRLRNAP